MQWSDIQFRPPERTLRQFAGTLARLRAAGHRELEQTA